MTFYGSAVDLPWRLRIECSQVSRLARKFAFEVVVATAVFALYPGILHGQQAAASDANGNALPDAPDRGDSSNISVDEAGAEKDAASVSGTVIDPNGEVVQGARVILAGPVNRVLVSGSNGEFEFSRLPAGTFTIAVSGAGMGNFISAKISLRIGEMYLVPHVVLPVAATTTDVRVTADPEELSEEQVHLAVQQRVLGIIPNFYSSYDWNAPPMRSKQKFQLAFKAATDPMAFAGAGALAGFEQWNNIFSGYGPGVPGYTRRYGAAYANDAIGRMMGSAVYPSLFHQDPRYFYRGSGSVTTRALYAMRSAFVCRGDNGHWQPNYSSLLGHFTAGGISNLYYPSASRGFSLTLVNGLVETAGNAGPTCFASFFCED
jgi:hypothetical protein